ncbi:MAG: UDP-N-acetylmuramate dehydrogenase [Gammaproteobacteria bacterium]|nr:UDP-N-acetylmuramate dehydrogenase [Gammaproteobacteria bacterium]
MLTAEQSIQSISGKILPNESLARYTTWRVGGPAELLYLPAHLEDLSLFLQQLPHHVPLTWIGLGSNVLIRDGGIHGAVIVTQGCLQTISMTETGLLRAEAGVAAAKLSRFAARQGLTDIEFMAGIPGTVGGALAMNAGCYGRETWESIRYVETINRLGQIRLRSADEFTTGYRFVSLPDDEWFVAGHFVLSKGDREKSLADIKSLLEKRNASQPTSFPNCGSVFRNPDGDYAGRLIELCDLKNMRIGGAAISEKHANFIINVQEATASDIEKLIEHIKQIVFQRCGVTLVPEVRMLGVSTR